MSEAVITSTALLYWLMLFSLSVCVSVKLYSPVNLTVDNSSSNGLYLYWNTSMSKSQCLESIVRYRSSTDSAWQVRSCAFYKCRRVGVWR